jgi:hypothetical protein
MLATVVAEECGVECDRKEVRLCQTITNRATRSSKI